MTAPKYPRTLYLPFSPGKGSSDDRVLDTCDHFLGKEVVITAKLDGSNFCCTSDECFARSHNGPPKHSSFDLAKAFHAKISDNIDDNIAISLEYMFATHSIHYTSMPHYMFVFNVLDMARNVWLSWDAVAALASRLDAPTVPLLYRGVLGSERDFTKLCEALMADKEFGADPREGVVVRLADEFANEHFATSIGKAVRPNHVASNEHWAHKKVVRNGIK